MSEVDPRFEYICGEIRKRLSHLETSATWYRSGYYLSIMSTALLAAIVTILAGLEGPSGHRPDVGNIILALGTLAIVSPAWGTVLAPRELWHLNQKPIMN
jgi:hypothetical protein